MLLPLKQGLKHLYILHIFFTQGVVMLLPLKQGLKLSKYWMSAVVHSGCYATSIKTRIETIFNKKNELQLPQLLCYFH